MPPPPRTSGDGRTRAAATLLASLTLAVATVGCSAGSSTEDAPASPAPPPSGTEDAAAGEGAGDTEDVAIAADGLELAGTVRLPDAEPPYPGVAIVHGSGPQSRQGLMPGQLGLSFGRPVAVYDQLAEGLRGRGFAVLTWDKRSCGPFNGCADNGYPAPDDDLTFAAFLDDAAAAVDHLAGRADVDAVSLIGHSQGGTIAGLLAAEHDALANVVLLATPVATIDEVLTEQVATLRRLTADAGQAGPTIDAAIAEVQDTADQVAAIADGEVTGPDVGGASRAFWASWIDATRRAPQAVSQASLPVLVLGGDQDWNVTPEQVRAWEPSLPPGGDVAILPGITHALTRLGSDDLASLTPADVGRDVDAEVIDAVAGWLEAR